MVFVMVPWILVAVAGGILVVAALAVLLIRKRKVPEETDYRIFYILGIVFTLMGSGSLVEDNDAFTPLFILGLVYLAIGLTNKDKWKRQQPADKRMVAVIFGGLLVFVLIGLLAYVAMN